MTYSADDLVPTWVGLVDDAAVFPPGDAPLHDAASAHVARRSEWWADLVGPLVVRDTDLPLLRGSPARLSVVVTGGAGQVGGPPAVASRLGLALAGLEVALRDLDDLAGNARRVVAAVDAAQAAGTLDDDVPVFVELPQAEPSASWLAAADEVAAAGLRLKLRTGGLEAAAFPSAATLAAWVDAALDRETPFKCTAGLHQALRHRDPETGFEHHGFVNLLTATARAFDGAGRDEVVAVLDDAEPGSAIGRAIDTDLAAGRRWFTSFGSCSVTEPLESLVATGLLEDL
ncbi:hypothetical protein [Nocardioides taihuensis]|uniref:Methylmalonyl-CoA mutase domain-containing protein n=1 Tax=Nocardioides taihuensis TaxID=1835606 RepID=A0ABW0BJ57_9ACTN